jgi:PAS domain S-box-containing protein
VLESGISEAIEEEFAGKTWTTVKFRIDQPGARPLLGGITVDASERKRAEDALVQSQTLMKAIVDSTSDMIWSVDPERFGLLTWNRALEEYFKRNRGIAIAIGMRPEDLFPAGSDFIETWRDLYTRALAEGTHATEYDVFVGTRVLQLSLSRLEQNGHLFGISVFGKDVTERKRAEQALQQSQEQFRAVVQTANEAMITINARQQVVFWNAAAERIFGFSADEMLGEPITRIVPGQFRQQTHQATERVLAGGERRWAGKTIEAAGLTKDGREFPIEMSLAEWRTGGGIFFTAIIRDITERKRAEERIELSERKYRELFRVNKDGIAIFPMSPDRRPRAFVEVNDAAHKMIGYTREEMLQMSPVMLEREVTMEQMRLRQVEFESTGMTNFETVLAHKDGHQVRAEFTSQLIEYGGQPAVMNIVRDITERKRTEDALKESEEGLRALFDGSPDAIFLADTETGVIIDANPKACELVARSRDEIRGMHQSRLHPPRTKEYSEESFHEHTESAKQQGKVRPVENLVLRSDGSEVPVEVLARTVTMMGRPVLQGVFRDITERKRAEEKIRSALEEKETLLREVHHRVKNYLQVIIALIRMQSKLVQDSEMLQFLKELSGQAHTMSLVYEQLFQSKNLSQVAMAPYLRQLTANILKTFGRGHAIQLHLDAPLTLDVAEAMPCGLIVNELFTNILKYAFPPGFVGDPAVTIALRQEGESYSLTVSDNGVGLPPHYDWNSGETLGLRLVDLWATHQLGGTLAVTSEGGTTFAITFDLKG